MSSEFWVLSAEFEEDGNDSDESRVMSETGTTTHETSSRMYCPLPGREDVGGPMYDSLILPSGGRRGSDRVREMFVLNM
jgi:hypothetical protein